MGRKADEVVDVLGLALAKTAFFGEVGKGGWDRIRRELPEDQFEEFQYKNRNAARRLWKKLKSIDDARRTKKKANGSKPPSLATTNLVCSTTESLVK